MMKSNLDYSQNKRRRLTKENRKRKLNCIRTIHFIHQISPECLIHRNSWICDIYDCSGIKNKNNIKSRICNYIF
jgi:hypothetical protein